VRYFPKYSNILIKWHEKDDGMITNTRTQVQFSLPDSRGSAALVCLPVWRPQTCTEGSDQRTATLAVKETNRRGGRIT